MSLIVTDANNSPVPQHIWKGIIPDISCSFNIYLLNNEDNTHTVIVLCDSGNDIPLEVTKFKVTYPTKVIMNMLDEGTLIQALIDSYLLLNQQAKDDLDLTCH